MNYKVLYRKYRPTDFENIVDQEYITTILKNSIKNNKVSHAYIFSGPRGTGKTTTAKVFAKSINCLNPSEKGPCNECEMCKNFENNPDVIEMDAASNNGVDEIREIIENVRLAPSSSKYKIYIIDEVHMLTVNAFNALLLTLEEPPENVVFIFATTNIENVPITILSRCQRFDFKKIDVDAIVSRLKLVCKNEKISAEDDALVEIAKLSDGGMRDALSILDQIQQENKKILVDDVQRVYGIVPKNMIDDVFRSYEEQNIDLFLEKVEKLRKSGANYKSLVKLTIDSLRKKSIEYIENSEYDKYLEYKKIIISLNNTINSLNIYIDPYILYEICFFESLSLRNEIKNSSEISNKTIKITDSKENKAENYFPGNNLEKKQIQKKIDNIVNLRVNNCFAGASKNNLNDIKNSWNSFVSSINDNNLINLLVDSTVVAASDDYIIVQTDNESTENLINQLAKKIEQNIIKYYNKSIKVVALSKDNWEKQKRIYINLLKSGSKYEYIEEKDEDELNDLENVVSDIFDSEKIKID